jgi:hypothetical protein
VATVVDKKMVKEAWDAIDTAHRRRAGQEGGGTAVAHPIQSSNVWGERIGGGLCSSAEWEGGHFGHPRRSYGGAQGHREDPALHSAASKAKRTHDLDVVGCVDAHRRKPGGEVEAGQTWHSKMTSCISPRRSGMCGLFGARRRSRAQVAQVARAAAEMAVMAVVIAVRVTDVGAGMAVAGHRKLTNVAYVVNCISGLVTTGAKLKRSKFMPTKRS